ncbi:MAG: efflux RND transporter periplasmic adaptor subunit [Candidatus Cloacimonas sp.]|jgi:HlyD family secretion protein|nr:efflux RND transporter periplasmic adaptor subunit [Candidatus Cloacimonas sp.]
MRNIYILLILLILAACKGPAKPDSWTGSLEGNSLRASSLVGGKILQMTVKEGDMLNIGDPIAIIDSRELEYQMEQLAASREELNAQEEISNTQIAQAEIDLEYQQSRQTRTRNLYEADVIPLQNLEDGEIVQTKASTQLKAAKQNLYLLAAKRKQIAANELTLKKKIADCRILSPGKGMVSTLYYRAGEVIPPMGQVLELTDTSALELNIYVSEAYLSRIKIGMPASLHLPSHSKAIPATVIRISNKAEFTPKTVLTPENRSVMVYAVRVRAENPDGMLKDGMPVEVTLP